MTSLNSVCFTCLFSGSAVSLLNILMWGMNFGRGGGWGAGGISTFPSLHVVMEMLKINLCVSEGFCYSLSEGFSEMMQC